MKDDISYEEFPQRIETKTIALCFNITNGTRRNEVVTLCAALCFFVSSCSVNNLSECWPCVRL